MLPLVSCSITCTKPERPAEMNGVTLRDIDFTVIDLTEGVCIVGGVLCFVGALISLIVSKNEMALTRVKIDVANAIEKLSQLRRRAMAETDGDEVERSTLRCIENHLTEAASQLRALEHHKHGRAYSERRRKGIS